MYICNYIVDIHHWIKGTHNLIIDIHNQLYGYAWLAGLHNFANP